MNKLFCQSAMLIVAIAIVGSSSARRVAADEPVHSVRGRGTLFGDIGQNVAIDAWLDDAGDAHGMVTWETATVGYPWFLAVTSLEVVGNVAYVEAIVVASPQFPDDEGYVQQFFVVDNGDGMSGTPDSLTFSPWFQDSILAGNIVVR